MTPEQHEAVHADIVTRARRDREQRAKTFSALASHAAMCGRSECLTCKSFQLLAEYVPFEPTLADEQQYVSAQLVKAEARLHRIAEVHRNMADLAHHGLKTTAPLTASRKLAEAWHSIAAALALAWYGDDPLPDDPFAPLTTDDLI
ncbi:hypothetical protein ACOZ38_25490 [Sphaerisporangium viridialbum]|uniref:hypothetical protein n=1 Tax=Sphaerisporangium viridialbum TaxID=46189 RepID=UPI003C769077